MKGWISKARNYASVETGTTMHSFSVGVVVESNHPDVAEGDVVAANTGWAEYAVADPERPTFRKVDPEAAPLSTALGILGINGFTAYFGLLAVGEPKPGDTVLVSTAAGAVGSAVGQIANIKGCRTVGIAGGAEKTALCTDIFGFDAAIDYKATDDLEAAIRDACSDGIDIYFDNVGGETLDIVLGQVNLHGRVVSVAFDNGLRTKAWMVRDAEGNPTIALVSKGSFDPLAEVYRRAASSSRRKSLFTRRGPRRRRNRR